MDPRLYPVQAGLPVESSEGDDGANYLRRLKGTAAEGSRAVTERKDAPAPSTGTSPEWKERRQSPRLRCSGSVEFRTMGDNVRTWGTLTDISLHGCYVEMSNTATAGTKVELVLKSFGVRIQAPGEVRVSYPGLGMGICFGDLEPEQRQNLRQLLDVLTGQNGVATGKSIGGGITDIPVPVDPTILLDAITEFFQKNQSLSREEFNRIVKDVRHS